MTVLNWQKHLILEAFQPSLFSIRKNL